MGGGTPGAEKGRTEDAVSSDDRGAIALLLLLYTLQGIPMGLGAVIPMLLLEKGAGSTEQAIFSVIAFPFAIKLLWAPLVDSIYSATFGRRKTWIVPMQALLGLMMIGGGARVDALLAPPGGGPINVRALTALFLTFYALAATQDIAVDGLALTVLSKANRELGATCNAIGQTLGTFLAYVVFTLLHSKGLVTLGSFMRLWGFAFLASIGAVLLMARNDEYSHPDGEGIAHTARRVMRTYAEMGTVLMLPTVRQLALVLLVARAPFVGSDVLLVRLLLTSTLLPLDHACLSPLVATSAVRSPSALRIDTRGACTASRAPQEWLPQGAHGAALDGAAAGLDGRSGSRLPLLPTRRAAAERLRRRIPRAAGAGGHLGRPRLLAARGARQRRWAAPRAQCCVLHGACPWGALQLGHVCRPDGLLQSRL